MTANKDNVRKRRRLCFDVQTSARKCKEAKTFAQKKLTFQFVLRSARLQKTQVADDVFEAHFEGAQIRGRGGRTKEGADGICREKGSFPP